MNTFTDLSEKISRAKALEFGSVFNDSIELFKKTWLQGFLLFLFTLIVMMPLIIIMYVPMLGLIVAQQDQGYTSNEALSNFVTGISAMYVLFVMVGVLVLGTISVALNAGFYRIMRALDNNQSVTTSDFFYFIKMKYLSKIFVLMLATFGISILAALLCYLPILYVMVPLSYLTMVYAFNPELSVNEIIKLSFQLGNKKWLLSFGLIIVASLLAQLVGFLLCGIGLLFTSTFVYHPTYIIYKHIIGFNESNTIDEVAVAQE